MLFVIRTKAKASLLVDCFSRSFCDRLLTLHHHWTLPGGSRDRAGVHLRSLGTQPDLGDQAPSVLGTKGRPCSQAARWRAGQGKPVPAVATDGFGGGEGKALACVLGVTTCTELALNIAFNFPVRGERDINSK